MFIDDISSQEIHEVALLDSEVIKTEDNPTGKCVSFWYYMWGPAVGSLHVKMGFGVSGMSWKSTIWELYGNQTNAWAFGQLPLVSNGKPLIVSLPMDSYTYCRVLLYRSIAYPSLYVKKHTAAIISF